MRDVLFEEAREDGMTEVLRLMISFGWEPDHAVQVRKLALTLFDQLKDLHTLGDRERRILEAAALLHDIGFSVSEAKHHKHSYRLIRAQKLPGFTADEVELIANVARYHRKAHPKKKHANLSQLSRKERVVISELSGILRLADGMDRSHLSSVKELQCRMEDDQLFVEVKGNLEVGLDIMAGNRKRDLFEQIYGVKVVVKADINHPWAGS